MAMVRSVMTNMVLIDWMKRSVSSGTTSSRLPILDSNNTEEMPVKEHTKTHTNLTFKAKAIELAADVRDEALRASAKVKFGNEITDHAVEGFIGFPTREKRRYSRCQESIVVSSELPVVLPRGKVRAHGVLALLPQNLLNEHRISHMNCQDGAEAGLPHGPIPPHSFQLGHEIEERPCENHAGYEALDALSCNRDSPRLANKSQAKLATDGPGMSSRVLSGCGLADARSAHLSIHFTRCKALRPDTLRACCSILLTLIMKRWPDAAFLDVGLREDHTNQEILAMRNKEPKMMAAICTFSMTVICTAFN
ncbi:hypothetical protein EYF80_008361 [Liparis tanakae]|uniref:Uncharacterized protein n=1 Tax=Liparis tanakae TaxID=230148 RepID=A0A4Z2IU05_9TELE|nr:hypothetical protein EYF80_008361 [Liparis tanakae]